MLKKTLAPLVTHRARKGRKFMDVVGTRYDKKELSQEEAQNVNEAPGLPELIDKFIERHRNGCLVPPEGGRIHILHVPVQMDREWQEAINTGGPNTPSKDYVREVGDQYPPKSGVVKEEEIILVDLGPHGGRWHDAISWAKEYQLEITNPRHVFAIGEKKPWLHRELGVNYMHVIATEECLVVGNRCACDVWWYKSERKCEQQQLTVYGDSNDWFAFLRSK